MHVGAAAGPWLEPFAARLVVLGPLGPAERLACLDRWALELGLETESGRPLRFVQADEPALRAGATPPAYELRIFEAGEVATRITGAGARHDLCNALAWLVYPRAKARLNALHAHAISSRTDPTRTVPVGRGPEARSGSGPEALACAPVSASVLVPTVRGPLRDAATLFDENGALWVGTDVALEDALRAFDWRWLFGVGRERLERSVRVAVFGHALLEKLDAPYKAITAHAWPLRLPPDAAAADVDGTLARSLEPGRLTSRALCPLPVMGLPGWCDANRDPAFYNDAAVFRAGRRRASRAPHAAEQAVPRASRSPRD